MEPLRGNDDKNKTIHAVATRIINARVEDDFFILPLLCDSESIHLLIHCLRNSLTVKGRALVKLVKLWATCNALVSLLDAVNDVDNRLERKNGIL